MGGIKLKAPAKLNLNLHIFPKKKESEYHLIEAVNCTLDLHDTLFFENQERKIAVLSDNKKLSDQEENLSYQAALLLKAKFGRPHFGARIFIKKEVPVKAGLGGGSSDAAATISGLANLWNLRVGKLQMLSLAKDLGMDVCYSLIGGLAYVFGFGEKVKKLNFEMPKITLLIVIPDKEKPSTAWVYQNLDGGKIGHQVDKINNLVKAVEDKDISKICQYLHNDFEETMTKNFPIISQIKKDFARNDVLKSILAGSGLAVVGFFLNKVQALKAKEKLSEKYNKIILTETL